jgi:ABC-type transporter Mla MlaB component
MTFLQKNDDDLGKLVLQGELTLDHIRPLQDSLKNALDTVRSLDIDMEDVTEIDLSFLQILCAAHRTAMKTGKTLKLAGGPPKVFQQAMDDNGYSRQSGCSLDAGKTCLWVRR